MALRKSDAKRIAAKWAATQPDIPKTRLIMQKGYSEGVGGRLFDIQYLLPYRPPYSLVHLYVLDDGTTVVKRDRRGTVRDRLAEYGIVMGEETHPRGYEHPEAVSRLMNALTLEESCYPDWFIEIESAPDTGLLSVIDAYANVMISESQDTRVAQVGIKIKTSKAAKARYFNGIAPKEAARTVVLVIRPEKTDEQIRSEFFHHVRVKIENRSI